MINYTNQTEDKGILSDYNLRECERNFNQKEDLNNMENKLEEDLTLVTPSKRKKNFKTFCRIRPHDAVNAMYFKFPNDSTSQTSLKTVLNVNSPGLVRPSKFYFNETFDEEFTQFEVFRDTCKDLIDKMITQNTSSCIISHGLKNSGKTFTTIGNKDNPGLLPIAMKYLYTKINDMEGESKVRIYCNFFEIYNEELIDLLDNKNKISMPSNYRSNVIKNIKYLPLNKLDDFSNAINIANLNKKVDNNNSSLTHTIFKLIIKKFTSDHEEEESSVSLIDMACSDQGYLSLDYFGKNSFCPYLKDDLRYAQYYLLKAIHNTIRYGGLDNRRVPFFQCQLTAYLKYFLCIPTESIILITNINPSLCVEENIKVLEFARKFQEFIKCIENNAIEPQKNHADSLSSIKNKRGCRTQTDYNKMKEKYDQLMQKFEMQNKFIESLLNMQDELVKKNTNDHLVDLVEKSIKGLDENNENKIVNVYVVNPIIRNLCLNNHDETTNRKCHLIDNLNFIPSTTTTQISKHLFNSDQKELKFNKQINEVQRFDNLLEEFSVKKSSVKLVSKSKSVGPKRRGRPTLEKFEYSKHVQDLFKKENKNLMNWTKFVKINKHDPEISLKKKNLLKIESNKRKLKKNKKNIAD